MFHSRVKFIFISLGKDPHDNQYTSLFFLLQFYCTDKRTLSAIRQRTQSFLPVTVHIFTDREIVQRYSAPYPAPSGNSRVSVTRLINELHTSQTHRKGIKKHIIVRPNSIGYSGAVFVASFKPVGLYTVGFSAETC